MKRRSEAYYRAVFNYMRVRDEILASSELSDEEKLSQLRYLVAQIIRAEEAALPPSLKRSPLRLVAVGFILLAVVIISTVILRQLQAPRLLTFIVADAGATTLLTLQGDVLHTRPAWQTELPLELGAQLTRGDRLVALTEFSMQVLCSDGETRTFTSAEIGDRLSCDVAQPQIQASIDPEITTVTRGGQQGDANPYLIDPRRTLIRTASPIITWNPIRAMDAYQVILRSAGQEEWDSGLLNAATVMNGTTAQLPAPIDTALRQGVPYTVEICAYSFIELSKPICTSDPGRTPNVSVAIYYVVDPEVAATENELVQQLGESSPQSLYARAVLLSQPIFQPQLGEPLGYYGDAIALLQTLRQSDDPLTEAAEPYLLLGKLYQRIDLPANAFSAYSEAYSHSRPQSESQAAALIGMAATTTDDARELYQQGLAIYADLLDESAFEQLLRTVCHQLGGSCNQLTWCAAQPDLCSG